MGYVLQSRKDRRVVRDDPNDSTKRQTCRHRTITIAQVTTSNLTQSDEGTKRATLSFEFPAGVSQHQQAPAESKWLCVDDSIDPITPMPAVNPNYVKSQTWEVYGPWEAEDFT